MSKALERVSIGYGMCGRRVPRAQLTKFVDDANCPACLARVAEKEAPGEDRGAVTKSQNSLPRNHKQGANDDEH